MVTAVYNRNGYRVNSDGVEIYAAGNHRNDSQTWIEPGGPFALPLVTIRKFARQTGKEIAAERGEYFHGIERIEED